MQLYVSEQLTLRTLEPRDAVPLFQITDSSRASLREWLPWVDSIRTPDDTLRFIQHCVQLLDEQKSMTFAICHKEQLIGSISFNQLDWQNRSCQIGYWLSDAFTGKGIMTKAVRALINYAFFKLDMNRIEIRCATGNGKSRSIPERLGFSLEGVIRSGEWLYDHYVDHAIYGLLEEEWDY